MMMSLLAEAAECGLLRSLDVQFAEMIAGSEGDARLQLAAACVSAEFAAGHVCLLLSQLSAQHLFAGSHPELAAKVWQAAGAPENEAWSAILSRFPVIGDGTQPTPLVLQQQRLYLQRMWHYEGIVADFIGSAENRRITLDETTLPETLNTLFPPTASHDIDWQKVAVAVAATRRVAVISGGPGTGKTTTVAKLLATLVKLSAGQRLRIQLAAPTGKAAARLTESLGQASRTLPLSEEERRRFPQEAVTLHRLLGAQPNSQKKRYHRENPLHLDLLVIDEASMVDLPMMAWLIEALPPSARVIFLGDRDQLASVEAGAVLGDLCRFAEMGYSTSRAQQLSQLCDLHLTGSEIPNAPLLRDSLCLLRKSYRFANHSSIGGLAYAVNAGEGRNALRLLQRKEGLHGQVSHYPLAQPDDYQTLLQQGVEGYRSYLELVTSAAPVDNILMAFSRYRLLCAVREGPFGVMGLNQRIEQSLQRAGLILTDSMAQRLPSSGSGRWYPGRPIMIGRNDSALGLFNGDIGIALKNAEGELRVYFAMPDSTIKSVAPNRLPEHETAYAMTVHKSQGSEFDHTALVLPTHFLPVLTRELVYTAITRARERLSLYADESVLLRAIQTPTLRRSGLVERLQQMAAK